MLPSIDLRHDCAPNVAPATIAAIIQVESGGNRFALGVNGPIRNRPRPKNVEDAARQARHYMAQGYSVDLGLMQINSANLRGLGYTVEQMFDPCLNLKAGSRILSRGYQGAVKRYGEGQAALRAALSAYNTGNYEHGFKNGYVAKYYPKKGIQLIVQASAPGKPDKDVKPASGPVEAVEARKTPINPYYADTTVYQAPKTTLLAGTNQNERL